jgi:ABC-type amino acid transport substrate-binding protein
MKPMRWMVLLALVLTAASCSTTKSGKTLPLRVGVTPNYPPIIMMQGDLAAGVECDFAAQLSSALGRPLELIKVAWDKQFDELDAGNIDIIMSGMTVTPARKVRATFCDTYMDNPLIAVSRRGESGRYVSAGEVLAAPVNVGVLRETSADAFIRRNCTNAKILPLSAREDVVFYLANQRIDLYVDDMAAAVGIVSRNEERMELVRIPLASQELAWAVRLGNEELKTQANEALARWRANGLRDQILDRWIPYRALVASFLAPK